MTAMLDLKRLSHLKPWHIDVSTVLLHCFDADGCLKPAGEQDETPIQVGW